MLSPLEIRPYVQLAVTVGGAWLCYLLGGKAGIALGIVVFVTFPATVAILGFGERPWQVINPLALYRVIRGFGAHYFVLLAVMTLYGVLVWLIETRFPVRIIGHAMRLTLELSFYGLIGGTLYLRRNQLGFEPSRSPERAAARVEAERVKVRAKMIDDVFQLVRIGKHVDATAPLSRWLRDADGEYASRDAYYVAEQVVRWDNTPALNTIGSTLIRHVLRAGRPDAALAVFEILRGRSKTFTMDSEHDLRTLADYAEAAGKTALAHSMRLETPVVQPRIEKPEKSAR